ncbi:MAG: carbonic anhydrase [Thermoplasmata archaeon]|nr:carbonic anhydrase [Thermoplasmata archaeon]
MAAGIDVKQRLTDGNSIFKRSVDPSVLSRLARKQEPFVAILTCSDSRVSPFKIFNLSLGDAFVVRVAGNSCSDPSVIGSLEYAVDHLHVRGLMVLGHTDCGAVRAVLDGHVTENLKKVARDIERAQSKTSIDNANDANAISESNVRLQIRILADSSRIIGAAVSEGKLALFGAMYDLGTGQVRFI